jgi:hypothetical protein
MGRPDQQPIQPKRPLGGVGGDLKRLKSEGAASAAELREFLGNMQGRSPQEVLGLVARSGLTRSIVLATILFAIVLAALTVIPYALQEPGSDAQNAAAEQPAANEPDAAQPRPAERPEDAAAEADTAAPAGTDRAVEAMGIGETRVADPGESPMEHKIDDLLDGID